MDYTEVKEYLIILLVILALFATPYLLAWHHALVPRVCGIGWCVENGTFTY